MYSFNTSKHVQPLVQVVTVSNIVTALICDTLIPQKNWYHEHNDSGLSL